MYSITDNVFDSPTPTNSTMNNQTMTSNNTSSTADSRLNNSGKKRSWVALKSPFSKRRR